MIIRKTHPLIKILNSTLIDLPSPSNISYIWNFGRLLGICLSTQIVTGLFLAIHFTGDTSIAFENISHISRDTNNGWIIRSIHANGARIFFILVYLHIGRGIYYSSFHLNNTWVTGVISILVLIGTAFLGYVLPWGQISFWGATVITNLLSALPYIGDTLTYWLWGGFSVNNATLTRFFALHFILPFILTFLIIIHIVCLHETGSNNPLRVPNNTDKVPFHPYFSWKDIFGTIILIIIFLIVVIIFPYKLSDPENFIPANSLRTPPHIQPEWYFLFAYAILRSIPNKLGGVIALFLSIIILLRLPITIKRIFNPISIYPYNKIIFWIFINIFLILTHLGACPVEAPYIKLRQLFTLRYFLFFIINPLFSNKFCLFN